MAKILDYLVENYIYVAAISGFFIIVLIGFLVKDKKKGKNKKNTDKDINVETKVDLIDNKEMQEEKTEVVNEIKETNEVAMVESNVIEPKMDFVKELEDNVVAPVEEAVNDNMVIPVEEVVNEQVINNEVNQQTIDEHTNLEYDEQSFDVNNVEPANNKFQVVLENKNYEEVKEEIPQKTEVETFDLDDTIVLNKKRLDEEIDIIDFSDINKFQPNDQIPNPINKDN